ncbi:hypothetical protein L596_009622 [Steinernema carpocapsae]|uniref:Uncharacterized protein n=1 Tax=Steinernema carpocapsae TaxID=34508 RepID=A0A4U5PGE4_STECR|nr:hypothetical protein L596_009622 [Steinernema carpocapsae]
MRRFRKWCFSGTAQASNVRKASCGKHWNSRIACAGSGFSGGFAAASLSEEASMKLGDGMNLAKLARRQWQIPGRAGVDEGELAKIVFSNGFDLLGDDAQTKFLAWDSRTDQPGESAILWETSASAFQEKSLSLTRTRKINMVPYHNVQVPYCPITYRAIQGEGQLICRQIP